MRLVRFLYCLCALLVSGAAHVSAAQVQAAGRDHRGFPPISFRHTLHLALTAPAHLSAAGETPEPAFQSYYSDESEDEESNDLQPERLPASGEAMILRTHPGFIAALRHPGNRFASPAPSLPAATATYILLGVLRI